MAQDRLPEDGSIDVDPGSNRKSERRAESRIPGEPCPGFSRCPIPYSDIL